MIRIRGFDHLVLCVSDAERSVAWYRDTLGLQPERLEPWRRGEVPFVSLRIDPTTLIDLIEGPRDGTNVDHFSLVVDDEVDLEALAVSGTVEVVHAPFRIWGARGHGLGMYISDPDGNTVELKRYAPGDDVARGALQ